MEPWLKRNDVTLYCGDNREVLPTLADSSVDAIVTDPPYGLAFMGKRWDYQLPSVEQFQECLRVLKPGGHLLCFAGTRTQHRMAVNIEDAGFEIRDLIAWVYGTGFPKSLDVSKAIDKEAGAGKPLKRMIPGADQHATGSWIKDNGREYQPNTSEPVTEAAKQWDGWGTALKPALEPITVARKPLSGTVADNVLQYGTGAINIDVCRIACDGKAAGSSNKPYAFKGENSRPFHNRERIGEESANRRYSDKGSTDFAMTPGPRGGDEAGRWPANVVHDGSDEVLQCFPHVESGEPVGVKAGGKKNCYSSFAGGIPVTGYGDQGSAARFFYCAKADQTERGSFNNHPTVKPIELMRWLVRLICPAGSVLLDPWAGSGSTAVAARQEHVRSILIEGEEAYCRIIAKRLEQGVLF